MNASDESNLAVLSEEWDRALVMKDHDFALKVAIQGYSSAKNAGDRIRALMFLGFVRHAANTLYAELSQHATRSDASEEICSFCRLKKSKLVKGVDVAICADCIEQAHSAAQSKTDHE